MNREERDYKSILGSETKYTRLNSNEYATFCSKIYPDSISQYYRHKYHTMFFNFRLHF